MSNFYEILAIASMVLVIFVAAILVTAIVAYVLYKIRDSRSRKGNGSQAEFEPAPVHVLTEAGAPVRNEAPSHVPSQIRSTSPPPPPIPQPASTEPSVHVTPTVQAPTQTDAFIVPKPPPIPETGAANQFQVWRPASSDHAASPAPEYSTPDLLQPVPRITREEPVVPSAAEMVVDDEPELAATSGDAAPVFVQPSTEDAVKSDPVLRNRVQMLDIVVPVPPSTDENETPSPKDSTGSRNSHATLIPVDLKDIRVGTPKPVSKRRTPSSVLITTPLSHRRSVRIVPSPPPAPEPAGEEAPVGSFKTAWL